MSMMQPPLLFVRHQGQPDVHRGALAEHRHQYGHVRRLPAVRHA
ncbi:hypothetical protein ACWEF9_09600 [Streptomyces sp. NPDC004980]